MGGILLFGASVILMTTEVDSTNRYRVIRWEGVNYHKTPTEYDWVYEGPGKDLKKNATICATPVAHWNSTKCDNIVTQPDADQCSDPECGNKGEGWKIKAWFKVTDGPEKGSYLPIRVPNIVRGHFVKVLELVGESHGSMLTVTGAWTKKEIMDGCYVLRKADHRPRPYKELIQSQWKYDNTGGQWYERQHDGAFIYYGRAKNSGQSFHRWCIFSKHNVCMYFADTDCDEISKIPAGGWSRPLYRPQPKDKVTVVVS